MHARSTTAGTDQLTAAAASYLHDFDWHTEVVANQLMLPLTDGVTALAVPAGRAGGLNSRLIIHHLSYPVLPLDDGRHRWVFLARCEHHCDDADSVFFATLLSNRRRLPLPPSTVNGKALEWIVDPRHCPGGLPPLAPLLGLLRLCGAG